MKSKNLQTATFVTVHFSICPGEVEDHGDGTYTITLTPQTAGPHQLLLTMDGQHVQKSPCDLYVRREYSTLCNPDQVINFSGGVAGIAIHDSGDIYVSCWSDNSIHVFDQAGQQRRTIGSSGSGDGQFRCPRGLFIKGDVMYVADCGNNCIQKLTTGGQFLQKFGQFGSGQGPFNKPFSVIVDHRDRLIIADHSNHRVVILDEAGTWLSKKIMTILSRPHMVLPLILKGTSMLQPMVLTASKSSHLRGPMSDHMGM